MRLVIIFLALASVRCGPAHLMRKNNKADLLQNPEFELLVSQQVNRTLSELIRSITQKQEEITDLPAFQEKIFHQGVPTGEQVFNDPEVQPPRVPYVEDISADFLKTRNPFLRQETGSVRPENPPRIRKINPKTSLALEKSVKDFRPSRNPFLVSTTEAPKLFLGLTDKPVTTEEPKLHFIKKPVLDLKQRISKVDQEEDYEEIAKEQARRANYDFSSNVEDTITGLSNTREEVRKGSKVEGSYSFNDGYFKRTVQYEADEKGFRIVGEEVEPAGELKTNVDGNVKVSNNVNGSSSQYVVTLEDLKGPRRSTIFE